MPDLKRRLEKVWSSFFGRFGGRLTAIQERGIPPLLDGRNVALIAPTASGKTEAAAAPILQRYLDRGKAGLGVLYVSPTRALAYDLRERLAVPLSGLGLKVAVQTAERREMSWEKPASILIVTPEGLDSLLCRHLQHLMSVQTVVLDELHMLLGGVRGDHLRHLVRRLRVQLEDRPLQTCILSATLAEPERILAQFGAEFVVAQVPGQRPFEAVIVEAAHGDDRKTAQKIIRATRARQALKVLVFVNKRDRAEQVAQAFQQPPFEGRVFVYHARLSKQERDQAEASLREFPAVVCVATATLEVGIDIGSIDSVVLYDPPHDVSSFLQRIGRGSRRRNSTFLPR